MLFSGKDLDSMIVERIIKDGAEKITVWDGTKWKGKSIQEETNAFLSEYKQKYPDKTLPSYESVYGEFFFARYASELTKEWGKIDIAKVLEGVEGKDFMSFDIFGGNGNIEVKTINNYLTRNDTPKGDPDPSGTIPFEIFHKWVPKGKDRDINELKKLYAGWLLSAYNFVDYNAIKEEHGREERAEYPGLYAFVLMGANRKPFACIVFENIYETLKKLYEICPDPDNWGIPNARTLKPATEWEYWAQFDARYHFDKYKGGMIQNVWHVPLRSVYTLTTVTLIDDIDIKEELMGNSYSCTQEVAQKRYDNLQLVADLQNRGNHFYPEKWEKEENVRIKEMEEKGFKVSKRNKVSLSGLEQLHRENEEIREWVDDLF